MKHLGYGIDDFIPCENCGDRASDVHHLVFRSQGGTNEIENLMGLCRECHNEAHNSVSYNEKLKIIHERRLK